MPATWDNIRYRDEDAEVVRDGNLTAIRFKPGARLWRSLAGPRCLEDVWPEDGEVDVPMQTVDSRYGNLTTFYRQFRVRCVQRSTTMVSSTAIGDTSCQRVVWEVIA